MGGGENGSDDGGRGGLAMGAGDGDAVFQAHEFRQHLGARNHRNLVLVRFVNFGIVRFDRRRGHHHVRVIDVAGLVAVEDRGAEILQAFRDRRRLGVGTGDGIAQRQQYFGDAAHADSANAYQMNALKIAETTPSLVSSGTGDRRP